MSATENIARLRDALDALVEPCIMKGTPEWEAVAKEALKLVSFIDVTILAVTLRGRVEIRALADLTTEEREELAPLHFELARLLDGR